MLYIYNTIFFVIGCACDIYLEGKSDFRTKISSLQLNSPDTACSHSWWISRRSVFVQPITKRLGDLWQGTPVNPDKNQLSPPFSIPVTDQWPLWGHNLGDDTDAEIGTISVTCSPQSILLTYQSGDSKLLEVGRETGFLCII